MSELPVRVVIEIPDSLDPDAADQKYVVPLRQVLDQTGAGRIDSVEQGRADTPSEFSRIVSVRLSDDASSLERVADALDEQGAPAGTVITSYDQNGDECDVLVFGPPETD